jgi:hypothetical protein
MVTFKSKATNQDWHLVNIYAPSTATGKMKFLHSFSNFNIVPDHSIIFPGDFNLIRSMDNRNKPGGRSTLMLEFNSSISQLGILEITLKGQSFTWSNKQQHPLWEKLDWCFVTHDWVSQFPGTMARTLERDVSDHVPWIIEIKTSVPKPHIFHFENYWMLHDNFLSVMQDTWNQPIHQPYPAKRLMAKFKRAREVLTHWQKQLPKLAHTIANTKLIIQFIELIEESRDLTVHEWNLRDIITSHLQNLLEQQRCKIKWAECGDAGTKNFHSHASVRHNHNLITTIQDDSGNMISDHEAKAEILWESYKIRLGTTGETSMVLDLSLILQSSQDLVFLEAPFSDNEVNSVIASLPNGKAPGPDGFNSDFLKKC